jgi:Fe-S oxidoreductase
MKIENPIATTENCRYSLMCRHVCPVGHVTHLETLTPHGWALTIASVKRGMLSWNSETVDVLYKCADCGNCRSHCATDQPLPEAIAAARAEVAAQNLAPAAVYDLDSALREWGNPYEKQTPLPVDGRAATALFVGDEARYLWPAALEAALTLLRAVDVEPVLIGNGRNNGYLASSIGCPETAAALAQANLDDLAASGAERLLVLTPGDYFTFKQLYDERLGLPLPAGVELVELLPFLAERLEAGTLCFNHAPPDVAYAYVDPTHSSRVKTRYEAPRRLLSAVFGAPGHELFWRCERTHPCGNLALAFTQPALAHMLTHSRLLDAQGSGAQLIITEEPGSLHYLSQEAAEFGLQVQGLYELLADQLA